MLYCNEILMINFYAKKNKGKTYLGNFSEEVKSHALSVTDCDKHR